MNKRRKSPLVEVSAELVEHLVTHRGLSHAEIAEMVQAEPAFVARVARSEREFSANQMSRIAERLGIPMGGMLLDALRPAKPTTGDTKQIMDLCERLILRTDDAIASMRAKKAS